MKNTTQSASPLASAPDRLVDHRRFNELLGLRCRTSHTARKYAHQGLIRGVHINSRVVRFSEQSIFALIGAQTGTPR